ncbi:hypothetical protein DEO72_LG4g125 [Vigna unguiculata]|uniref:Uncharacterized protein n=1 Tax=Vigna unguiculata TaxID=3917 RepID=A0A4D6LLP6_VIGUN|nr:hypothetical protein DEO72_LG4g125 [Vigna unguiculata]
MLSRYAAHMLAKRLLPLYMAPPKIIAMGKKEEIDLWVLLSCSLAEPVGDLPNEALVKEFYANAYQKVRTGPRQAKVFMHACATPLETFDIISSNVELDMDVGALILQYISYIGDAANVNLGFLAIITTLCREKDLVSDAHVLLSLTPPLDRKFFHKNCTTRTVDAPTLARQPHHFLDNVIMKGTQFEARIPWLEGRLASQLGVMCLMMVRRRRRRKSKSKSRKSNNKSLIHYGVNNRKSSKSLFGVVDHDGHI